ncbi:MAG TPA: DUF2142 domain-containing protein [Thermoanaerobaculia bacterium]|nr:DUF2142 domain-containing protein [Thermoanaerobaculia bacterium]
MRPDRFLLVAGLACGLAFVFGTPPFQAPDETTHFYRAYAVSEGNLGARRGEEGFGAVLPASLQEIGTGLRGELPFRPGVKMSREKIFQALRVPLEPERRRFTDYRTSALFTPVSYLPQAAGIALARWLGAGALVLLYAARLANLLAATVLIAVALRRLPSYPWLFAMLALTPMALFLRASASADALSTAAAFLLAATVAKLAWGEEEQGRWRDVIVLTACSTALCLSKPVYVTLALLVLLIPAVRFPKGRRGAVLLVHGTVTAAAFAVALTTAGAVDVSIRPDTPIDPDRQIEDALADPLRVAGILTEDYLHHGRRYVAQIVGQLGWLDVNLPKPLLWGYALVLGLLALLDTRREVAVSAWQRALLVLIAVATLALISASQYASWTSYGAGHVEGIQGRYFIPLAPAVAWIFHTRRFPTEPALLNRVLPWLSLVSLGIAFWTLLHRYYGS